MIAANPMQSMTVTMPMIPTLVIALFILAGVLVGLRFFKKKDPFGDLDSEMKSTNESAEHFGNQK